MYNFKDIRREGFKRPGVRKAYEALKFDPEFALIDRLIEKRRHEGLTQAKLAKKMKTKQSVISRFESGDTNPTWEFLKKLADALGTDMKITFKDRAPVKGR